MIDILIESKVRTREWNFNEISNLKPTIELLATEIYSEMSLLERFELIREKKVQDSSIGESFEAAFRQVVMAHLKGEVAEKIRKMLDIATISFGGKNEVSERSMGGESHKERSADEEKNSEDEE